MDAPNWTDTLHDVARDVPDAMGGHKNTGDLPDWQSHKPLISDIYGELQDRNMTRGMSLAKFKAKLLQAHKEGKVRLARNDMPMMVPDNAEDTGYKRVARSEIADQNATYHTLDTNAPAAKTKKTHESKDASGHEHKGPGEGGGQFTSGGGGGGKTEKLKSPVDSSEPSGYNAGSGEKPASKEKPMVTAKNTKEYADAVKNGENVKLALAKPIPEEDPRKVFIKDDDSMTRGAKVRLVVDVEAEKSNPIKKVDGAFIVDRDPGKDWAVRTQHLVRETGRGEPFTDAKGNKKQYIYATYLAEVARQVVPAEHRLQGGKGIAGMYNA